MTDALLFRKDEVEEVETWPEQVGRLGKSTLLWIDLERPDEDALAELAEALGLEAESVRRLQGEEGSPYLGDFETYLHVTVCVPRGEKRALERVECLVSTSWVVTVRDGPVEVVRRATRARGGLGGRGPARRPGLPRGHLHVGARGLPARVRGDRRRARARRRPGDAGRRSTAPCRCSSSSVARSGACGGRLSPTGASCSPSRAPSSAGSPPSARQSGSRGCWIGSARSCRPPATAASRSSARSTCLMTQVGQRTNDIMKTLTLVSLLLLPGTLLAGVLGMNFKVGLFDHPELFWVALASMV